LGYNPLTSEAKHLSLYEPFAQVFTPVVPGAALLQYRQTVIEQELSARIRKNMNIKKLIQWSVAVLALQLFVAGSFAETYELKMTGTCVVPGGKPKPGKEKFDNKRLIDECLVDHTDLEAKNLVMVYTDIDDDTGAINIVDKRTGDTVCELFVIDFGVSFTSNDGTTVIKQAFLYPPGLGADAIGSIVMTIKSRPNSELKEITGSYQLGQTDGEVTEVCTGAINTVRVFVARPDPVVN
jgi:hypothetical protein